MCIEVDDIKKAIEDVKDKVRPLTSEPKVGYSVRVSWFTTEYIYVDT